MDGQEDPPESRGGNPIQLTTWVVMGLAVVLVAGLIGVRMEHQPDSSRAYPSRPQIPDGATVLLPAPEIDDEYLPCSDCHERDDGQTNLTVREMDEEHDEMEFSHGNLWCLNCHDVDTRDSLRLSDGSLVAIEDSWKLCTQCHSHKLADWRAGVHGKRTGHWRGPKEYRTCVVCHDPHNPPFKPIAPKPPPIRPDAVNVQAHQERSPLDTSNAGGRDGEDS